jgi:hypothetical protein
VLQPRTQQSSGTSYFIHITSYCQRGEIDKILIDLDGKRTEMDVQLWFETVWKAAGSQTREWEE